MRVVGRAGPAGTLVCGAEFSGEVGERQTTNLTHRPAAGGARESGAGAFVCARECVYLCRALVRCASRQCPSTSPPSSSTPSLRPPSFPATLPRPHGRKPSKSPGKQVWGGGRGRTRQKGLGFSPPWPSGAWGAWDGASAKGGGSPEEPERPQRRRGEEEPDHGVQVRRGPPLGDRGGGRRRRGLGRALDPGGPGDNRLEPRLPPPPPRACPRPERPVWGRSGLRQGPGLSVSFSAGNRLRVGLGAGLGEDLFSMYNSSV